MTQEQVVTRLLALLRSTEAADWVETASWDTFEESFEIQVKSGETFGLLIEEYA